MNDELLQNKAKILKLYGLIANWEDVRNEVWLEQIIQWEEDERSKRSHQRRLDSAHIDPFTPLVNFDWNWPKKCDKETIEELMQLEFIKEAANVILCGPSGVGKTTIASNLAHQAVIQGHDVLFTTAGQMITSLISQDGENSFRRRLKYYLKPQLLCIDEVGYLSYTNRAADLLFEIISKRQHHKSTIITTNKPFTEWNSLFSNASCVVALIDRLVHKSEIINIDGDSYRLKEAQEKSQARKEARSKKKNIKDNQ